MPGAYGIVLRFSFPTGEHAHESYSVSAIDFVTVEYPVSTLIVLPNPSSVVLVHRPLPSPVVFTVAVTVGGEFVYVYVVDPPWGFVTTLGRVAES